MKEKEILWMKILAWALFLAGGSLAFLPSRLIKGKIVSLPDSPLTFGPASELNLIGLVLGIFGLILLSVIYIKKEF